MKRAILIGVPHHGNLGDSAIQLAEMKFIKDYLKEYEIKTVPENNLRKCVKKLKQVITKEDLIFLHGGGNIRDTYTVPEEGRREIIKEFPDNQIIIFPQTIYFEEDEQGKKELQKSKEIYNAHPKLIMVAREKTSYEFAIKNFGQTNVILTPDIVFYLEEAKACKRQDKVLSCFRDDKEKKIAQDFIIYMENLVKREVKEIKYTDTHIGKINDNIYESKREELVEDKWSQFREAKLVITDRLHGMIFAAITQTPCIAFGNFNHKIKDSFEWIKHLQYVQYVEDVEDKEAVRRKIDQVLQVRKCKYSNEFAKKEYEKIIREIDKGGHDGR